MKNLTKMSNIKYKITFLYRIRKCTVNSCSVSHGLYPNNSMENIPLLYLLGYSPRGTINKKNRKIYLEYSAGTETSNSVILRNFT